VNALNSDWISSEAAERAYDAVEEAYRSGHLSLIPPVLGAAAESYVDSQILEYHNDLIGPESSDSDEEDLPYSDDNEIFCSIRPRIPSERSMRARIEYLEYGTYTSSEDLDRAQELWDIRNQLMNEIYPVLSAEGIGGRLNIETYIQDFEGLIGHQGTSITERLEPDNREVQIRSGTRNREEFLEVMVSDVLHSGQDELLFPAATLAYERFTQDLDEDRPIRDWLKQDAEVHSSDRERYEAFENQRNLISHNLEAFHAVEIDGFTGNLRGVMSDMVETESIAEEQVSRWSGPGNLRIGPPAYKTEALIGQDNKWYLSSEREERLEQLENLREQGEAYSYNFDRTHTVEDLQEFDEGEENLPEERFSTAGRTMEIRSFGELVFMDLRGERDDIQLIVREDEDLLEKVENLYRGDIVGVEGPLTYTNKGEFSLHVETMEVLSRGLRHIPKEHFGVEDEELKYRDRPLHLTVDMGSREKLRMRSEIISEIRRFLEERGFMEVETPVIQPVYGGTRATPFETHIEDKDMDAYLRIAKELYLKRMVIGGYERIFEIGPDFRNESIDTTHNPEFTMMELYRAYADYEDIMVLTEEMYEHVAREVTGSAQVEYQGETLDFTAPWTRMTMNEAIEEYGGFNVEEIRQDEIKAKMRELGIELESDYERGMAIAEIFEEVAEEKLVQPVHIIDHPEETTPLCMPHREKKGKIERFESFAMGIELCNAYTELRDPIRQRELFEEEQRRQEEGEDEAHPIDMDFLEALELGMPPTGGLGIGIGRMAMLMTDSESIREVIAFPMMKE
jgi:lysyl-tRNA synthetase class 2